MNVAVRARLHAWARRRADRWAEAPARRGPRSVGALLDVSNEAWDREILATDPQAFRLDREAAARAIAAGVADGRAQAVRCGAHCTPAGAAAQLGVPVVIVAGANRFGPLFQFAEYRSRPACISIFATAMDQLRAVIEAHELADVLGLSDPEPVYLAHELYHHLDTLAAVPIARRAPITMFALGPIRVRSGLVSLAEIGAASFAMAMTGLRCHPRMLDSLILERLAKEG